MLQMVIDNSELPPMQDASFPDITLTTIAFGSCHSRGALNKRLLSDPSRKTIWDTIATVVQPQTFLWTGDAIYPPMEVKGDYPLEVLKSEFHQMKTNTTLGYASFIKNTFLEGGVHGTWDDHDYGGNDRGHELKGKEERRDAYLDFLGVKTENNDRPGVYNSVEFGTEPNKVKVIFLDTRYNRSKHCIPSVGSNPYLPQGAILACLTRLFTSRFNFCQDDKQVLGEEQWAWFERKLTESTASMHVIVSSIQVLTTNPVVESWGHFPNERKRLLKLINPVPGMVLLSGDVHHAEISSTKRVNVESRPIIEVTSSGLTHSCVGGWFGPFCKPILDYFPKHRFQGGNAVSESGSSYFTEKNFGSISVDWNTRKFQVKVHNEIGGVELNTGPLAIDVASNLPNSELNAVDECIVDNVLTTYQLHNMVALVGVVMIGLVFLKKRRRPLKHTKHD